MIAPGAGAGAGAGTGAGAGAAAASAKKAAKKNCNRIISYFILPCILFRYG